MTVGFPQPRVRELLPAVIRSAFVASMLAGLVVLSVAGCGGSNPMHPDSGTKKDMGGVQPGID